MRTERSSGRAYADLLDPEGADTARRNDLVRRAWGEWLDEHEWDRFITLTFPTSPSEASARRRFEGWIARVAARAGHDIRWFRMTEHVPYHQRHVHALLSGSGELADELLQRLWGKGRCKFEVYDRTLGGAYYITKAVGRSSADYDVDSVPWTRRADGPCNRTAA